MEKFYLVISYRNTIYGTKIKHAYFEKLKDANSYINRYKKSKTYNGYKLLYYNVNKKIKNIELISKEL